MRVLVGSSPSPKHYLQSGRAIQYYLRSVALPKRLSAPVGVSPKEGLAYSPILNADLPHESWISMSCTNQQSYPQSTTSDTKRNMGRKLKEFTISKILLHVNVKRRGELRVTFWYCKAYCNIMMTVVRFQGTFFIRKQLNNNPRLPQKVAHHLDDFTNESSAFCGFILQRRPKKMALRSSSLKSTSLSWNH